MKAKRPREFLWNALVSGVLIVLPAYLVLLVVVRLMQAVAGFLHPVALLLPGWVPVVNILSLVFLLLVCLAVGLLSWTAAGQAARECLERSVFDKLPGYSMFRSLTRQLTGSMEEHVWQPALVELEEALVPAFVVEELADGRYTVFVPSVPTPLAGAVYILSPERVHCLDVPFTQATKAVARWGLGSKELVAAMKPRLS